MQVPGLANPVLTDKEVGASRFDDPFADGVTDECRGGVQIEFGHDPRPVGFHRSGADAEDCGNLFVGFTVSEK
jgi:hypothetical protein